MGLRLKKLTLNLPFGLGGVDVEVSDAAAQRAERRLLCIGSPKRVMELAAETERAVECGQLRAAVDRLLTMADEFHPSARREATLISARTSALLVDRAQDRLAVSAYIDSRADLFRDILDQSHAYVHSMESLDIAAVAAHTVSPPANVDTSASVRTGTASDETATVLPAIRADMVEWNVGGARKILEQVSLQVAFGEVLGVVGPNGSGKTSLLRLLARQTAPTAGRVSFPAFHAAGASWGETQDAIGYVPQAPTLYHGSIEMNLRRYAALRGILGVLNDDEVNFAMARFDLIRHKSLTWDALSGGFKTRFELARLLLSYPSILILDEPLAALDPAAQRDYLRALKDLATSGRRVCIVLTSQDVHAVEEVADHVILLQDGAVKFTGRPADIRRNARNNLYELAGVLTADELAAGLSHLSSAEVSKDGTRTLVVTDRSVSAADLLQALIEAGETLRYFRDLSNSTQGISDGIQGGESRV